MPDRKDHALVMASGTGALGAGVEGDCGVDVLVAEELAHDLVLPRVAVEEHLPDGMTEAMSRHIETGIGVDELLDLSAESAFTPVPVAPLAREQVRVWPSCQNGPPLRQIDIEQLLRVAHQRELEVIAVLHLGGRKAKMNHSVA